MTFRRLFWRTVLILISLTLAYFLVISGWLFPQKTWQETTGYNTIPLTYRPEISPRLPPDTSKHTKSTNQTPSFYWLGHAGFLVQWYDKNILLDPNLNDRCTAVRRLCPTPCKPKDLPSIDAILISHSHFDHMDAFTLKELNHVNQILVPTGSGEHLPVLEAQVNELDLDQSVLVGPLKITPVPAKHNGGRFHPLKDSSPAFGFIISDGAMTVYFAGDTGFGEHFEAIGKTYHPDVAILPIGAYAPSFPLRYFHLNPIEALSAAKIMKAHWIIPCHFGTFRLSLDPADQALPWFARLAYEQKIQWHLPPLFEAKLAGDTL